MIQCNTQDANFNTTALVDATPESETEGEVVERYSYAAYGEGRAYDSQWSEISWSGSLQNDIRYAGYGFDAESGLYHTQRRELHSSLGTFIERDFIGYADGMSLYQYCRSNPVALTDPMGLCGGTAPDEEVARYEEYLAEQAAAAAQAGAVAGAGTIVLTGPNGEMIVVRNDGTINPGN